MANPQLSQNQIEEKLQGENLEEWEQLWRASQGGTANWEPIAASLPFPLVATVTSDRALPSAAPKRASTGPPALPWIQAATFMLRMLVGAAFPPTSDSTQLAEGAMSHLLPR
jgi:hypothetical protein